MFEEDQFLGLLAVANPVLVEVAQELLRRDAGYVLQDATAAVAADPFTILLDTF